jgi:hypothetical protein
MAFEDSSLDRCEKPPQSEFSALGKEAGTYLLRGDTDAVDRIYGEEQAKQDATNNMNIARAMWTDFVLGVACIDPTDVHLINKPDYKGYVIDGVAEAVANKVIEELDQFSPKHDGGSTPTETPEEAVQGINTWLQGSEIWNSFVEPQLMRNDFVNDFNRRRLESKDLPNFDAYIDPSDHQAKIRYLAPKIDGE